MVAACRKSCLAHVGGEGAEDPAVWIKPLHKLSEAQARLELEAVGLRWAETQDFLPQQHFLVFEKPFAPEPAPR